MLLLYSEKEEIERLVRGVKANMEFCGDIYDEATEFVVPAIGKLSLGSEDLPLWKGKADIITSDKIIDLKTTSKIGPQGKDFRRSAYKYNYDSQAYIYQQLFGKPLVFYVIEKGTGRLATADCDEEFLDHGRQKVIEAANIYLKFFGKNATDDIGQHVTRIFL